MSLFNLKDWLRTHSTSARKNDHELVFTHPNGETSILLPRETWKDNLIAVKMEPFSTFYSEYFGASIGNSQIMLGTTIRGGVDISHGFRLQDIEEMGRKVRELEVPIGASEQVFMVEAAWMFIYTLERESGIIRVHDRDFGTSQIIPDLHEVFESWWTGVVEG
jgi:hypothetical protein